jgi:hypothetical protein
MAKPIFDKAEVSIDFPDKFYMGSFSRESRFDVSADTEGVHLWLERPGKNRRKVGFHIHYHLLADMLETMADAVRSNGPIDKMHRDPLADASERLKAAFSDDPPSGKP